jgi:NitT/TauT family transport system permease protein
MTQETQGYLQSRSVTAWSNSGHLLQAARVALFLIILIVWELGSSAFDLLFWISSPTAIASALVHWYQSGTLWNDVGITVLEAGVGFVIGSLGGAIVGFCLGWVRVVGALLEPFVLGIYTLPKVALAPLFVLWFGIGLTNKIMFSGLLVFFMVFFTTFQGARQVDREVVTNARILGATPLQTWTTIAIPYAAVWVFTGLRIGLPYALIGAIVGEFVAASEGVGYRIKEATAFFDTASVFAGLFVLMVISSALLVALRLIEKRVLSWQEPSPVSAAVAPETQKG